MSFDVTNEYFQFIGQIQHLDNLIQQMGDAFYEEISAKQWYVLCHIASFGEEAPTLNQLSEGMRCSHQNIKQMALKLERKGYVSINTDPHDRRKRRVALTEHYTELWKKYAQRQEQFLRTVFAQISPEELEVAQRTLEQLEANFRAAERR